MMRVRCSGNTNFRLYDDGVAASFSCPSHAVGLFRYES
jgi:hypothetical protein